MDERDVRLLKAISDLGTGSPERLHEETGNSGVDDPLPAE